ncbi:hypothetical protein [Flavobacterium lacus]|nr:hypothetical protein [Flavobacterium lacus]
MTAKLAYEIIMTLPETEKEILFSMLEPHIKPFDIEDFIDEAPMNKEQIIEYLIKTVFSKKKNNS